MKLGNLKPGSAGAIKYSTWVKCYENDFVQTTATSVSITGLNGDTDKEYKLEARIVGGANSDAYYLRYNSDSSLIYGLQNLVATDTTITATRDAGTGSFAFCTGGSLNKLALATIQINAKSGYIRTHISNSVENISSTSVNTVSIQGGCWNETSANITSILIFSSQTNGLNSGSHITLWKRAYSS